MVGKRVLVCGDRNWTNKEAIRTALAGLPEIAVVIHGAARGTDTLAGEVAAELGIPVLAFPADWDKHGKAAGPIRNTQMLNEGHPDLVLAFHANIHLSKGTKDMVRKADRAGVQTRVILS